jgi:hypothetical protein
VGRPYPTGRLGSSRRQIPGRHVLPTGLRSVRYYGFCHPTAKANRLRVQLHSGKAVSFDPSGPAPAAPTGCSAPLCPKMWPRYAVDLLGQSLAKDTRAPTSSSFDAFHSVWPMNTAGLKITIPRARTPFALMPSLRPSAHQNPSQRRSHCLSRHGPKLSDARQHPPRLTLGPTLGCKNHPQLSTPTTVRQTQVP